jgi:hypothetical protein
MGLTSRKRKGSDSPEALSTKKKAKASSSTTAKPEKLEDDEGNPYWAVRYPTQCLKETLTDKHV